MSDPRASIQRAVAAPPARPAASTAAPLEPAVAKPVTQLIGKPHGRMRCVNISLSESAALRLRRVAAERSLTLGEALMESVQSAVVPHSDRRGDRAPQLRRNIRLVNVYALLTTSESADLSSRAARSGRTVSDYADCAVRGE
jgi:hypothetical protein